MYQTLTATVYAVFTRHARTFLQPVVTYSAMDWSITLYQLGTDWHYRVELGPERWVVACGGGRDRDVAREDAWAAWKFVRDLRRGHGRPAHART